MIAKKLNTDTEQVQVACRLILTLNPKPRVGLSTGERLAYITPDVIVSQSAGKPDISINDGVVPDVGLSGYYLRLHMRQVIPR